MSRFSGRLRSLLVCAALLMAAGCAGVSGSTTEPDLLQALSGAVACPDRRAHPAARPPLRRRTASPTGHASGVEWRPINTFDFNESALDQRVWNPYNSIGGFGNGFRRPSAITVENGTTADHRPRQRLRRDGTRARPAVRALGVPRAHREGPRPRRGRPALAADREQGRRRAGHDGGAAGRPVAGPLRAFTTRPRTSSPAARSVATSASGTRSPWTGCPTGSPGTSTGSSSSRPSTRT